MKSISLIHAINLIDHDLNSGKTTKFQNEQIERFEPTKRNMAIAEQLVGQILGTNLPIRSLKTKILLLLIEEMVEKSCNKDLQRTEYHFTLHDILDYTGWSKRLLKIHIRKLEDAGYLVEKAGFISIRIYPKDIQIIDSGIRAEVHK